ncbi:MAG: single-stranded DNA-binding protein [Lachnospiraceae bacterium]|jgi:hypothetical protein|nr:single-stranded DNA-binding protein [Lachnospiraceae bacterium]
MSTKEDYNNYAFVRGTIAEEFILSHELYEERFYLTTISVLRNSGVSDDLLLMVPDCFIDPEKKYKGLTISVVGQYRSHTIHVNKRRQIKLWIFAKKIKVGDQIDMIRENNQIYLRGYLKKPPTVRISASGWLVSDLVLEVPRSYGKSDSIPCVCWAIDAGSHSVGELCIVRGRIQSRKYQKQLSDGEICIRTAYEVAVRSVEFEKYEHCLLDHVSAPQIGPPV